MRVRALAALAACGLAGAAVAAEAPVTRAWLLAQPVTPALGGDTTRMAEGGRAFTYLIENAGGGRMREFQFGNRVFNTNWVQAPGSVAAFDGLGPVFNRVSCAGCHVFDGRGRPPEGPDAPMTSMLLRLSVPGTDGHGGPRPHPVYGDQLNDRAIQGVPAEGRVRVTYTEVAGTYGDGTPYRLRRPGYTIVDLAFGPLDGAMTSPRVAPQMIGLGLLENVPASVLEALADPEDADGDGISGRINRVWSPSEGGMRPGRFGWKANAANLVDQDSGAALGDVGLTTRLHPDQNCPAAQAACRAAYDQSATGGAELSDLFLERLVFYTRAIAVPRQRHPEAPEVARGAALFRTARCDACHVPTLVTGPDATLPELANQSFHPFTDLLLHDMGPDLADGRPDFAAGPSEWRTPPLWGIGLIPAVNGHDALLHDGRARGVAEAILWHGGEGAAARDAFRTMDAADRAALVAFVNTL